MSDDQTATVPEGWEWVTWNPMHSDGIVLPRTFAGVVVISDGTVRLLADNAVGQDPSTTWLPDLTPVERAVTVARLRAWADALEATSD